MGVLEDLADGLARDALAAAKELGDETLVDELSKIIGDTSQTTQEAFLTSVRVRRAEERGRAFLEKKLAEALAKAERDAKGG